MALRLIAPIVAAFAITLVTSSVAVPADDASNSGEESKYLGVWRTHFEQTKIILIIQPHNTANFILLLEGSRQIAEGSWKPMPGGVLVEWLPRFRFWRGRDGDEVCVFRDRLHPDMTNSAFRSCPLSFLMRREDLTLNLPAECRNRLLPADWNAATPHPQAASPQK